MKMTKIYIFAFMAMFMLSFSSAWADIAYVKVTAEDGTVSWTEIEGVINGSTIELYNTYVYDGGNGIDYFSTIDCSIKGVVDLNEVWSQSGRRGINYQVTSIGNNAFEGCSGLTSVTIPSSVTSIGNNAFLGCSGLTSVIIPSSVTSIGCGAFQSCSSLTSVIISSSVTSIENFTFSYCNSLTSISIPSSVTSIGNSAFSGCSSLKEVEINSNTVGSMWFRGLQSINKITLGEQVKKIDGGAFYDCSGLTSINISSSVTRIGDKAFWGCNKLTEVVISDIAAWCNISFANYLANPLKLRSSVLFERTTC